MLCQSCGYSLAPENNFCPNCGCPVAQSLSEGRPGYNGVPYPTKAQSPVGPAPRPGYNGVPYPTKEESVPALAGEAPIVPAPPARPAKPEKSPQAKAMRRAYNLGTLWSALIFIVQSTVVSLAVTVTLLAFILPAAIGFTRSGGLFDSIRNVFDMLSDGRFLTVFGIVYAISYAIGMGLGFLLSKLIRKRVEKSAPERRPISGMQFLVIALIAFGLWGIGVILGNWASLILPVQDASSIMNSVPMLIVAMIGAPIFEELIFRKFLIDRLLPFGEKAAVVFTALLFGMAHMNAGQFFLAFLLGLLFAVVYIRTGNILYTMALHFMINTVASFDTIGCMIFGDGFDTVWLIVVGVLALVGIAAIIVFRKQDFFVLEKNREPDANWAAFRGWGFVLVKIVTVISVIATGLLSVIIGITQYGGAALIHLIPAALCVVAIFVISAKAVKKYEAPPAEEPLLMTEPAFEPEPPAAPEFPDAPAAPDVPDDITP